MQTMKANWLIVTAWLGLLAGALLGPRLDHWPRWGDEQTRWSVRVALLFYAAALAGMLLETSPRVVRLCWTLACLTFVVHVLLAFHHVHHWSHAEAVRHTQERSGFGEGVFASYAFTLLWAADVTWWWSDETRYTRRPRWIDGLLHGFMLFIVFNATVIFESGLVRWAGLAGFALLAALWSGRRFRAAL